MNPNATTLPPFPYTAVLHTALVCAVTDYDRKREGKKGHNPYALAHYFGAIDDAMELVAKGTPIRAALLATFNDRLLDCVLKSVGEKPFTREEKR